MFAAQMYKQKDRKECESGKCSERKKDESNGGETDEVDVKKIK